MAFNQDATMRTLMDYYATGGGGGAVPGKGGTYDWNFIPGTQTPGGRALSGGGVPPGDTTITPFRPDTGGKVPPPDNPFGGVTPYPAAMDRTGQQRPTYQPASFQQWLVSNFDPSAIRQMKVSGDYGSAYQGYQMYLNAYKQQYEYQVEEWGRSHQSSGGGQMYYDPNNMYRGGAGPMGGGGGGGSANGANMGSNFLRAIGGSGVHTQSTMPGATSTEGQFGDYENPLEKFMKELGKHRRWSPNVT